MAYSMTGFGRAEMCFGSRRYTVEIKSVNSRYCDINIRMPRLFNFAEASIRRQISTQLGRGKVDAFINFEDSDNAATEIVVNEGLAISYSEAVSRIAEISGREDELSASRLSLYTDVLTVRQKNVDEDMLADELTKTVDAALGEMLKMRQAEGQILVDDILVKIGLLEELHAKVVDRAPTVVEDYRARLSARIDEILDSEKRALYDDARLAAEVTVFADKCAIDEEIKRLSSHFAQARSILSKEKQVGKKMDFLVQEINRETNTIGSKANDIELTNAVLLMKNEIEKIREQIQNLV